MALDPDAEGEVHTPLNCAPSPGSLARSLFDQQSIKAHLDHHAAAQGEDGGWTFNWTGWSLVAHMEWRGFFTDEALTILRANGRI